MNEENKAGEIVNSLCENGWEAYIAGGAARDLISGAIPSDFDVVTNASYNEIRELFKGHKLSVVGVSFKVCIVDGIEVATYRKNLSFDNNNEIIADSIHEDLKKRDLTINAMAFCPWNGDIVDISNGQKDLKNRVIRFNGSPKDRINEDPCRILRAARFLAKIEGTFAPDTLQKLKEYSHLVKNIAPERIRLEILKVMKESKPSIFFDALHEIDALKYISQGFENSYGFDGGPYHNETVATHIKIAGDSISDKKPLLRLAAFYHDHGKPPSAKFKEDGTVSFIGHELIGADLVENELIELKFSSKEIAYVKNLVKFHLRSITNRTKPKTVRKLLMQFQRNDLNWKDWLQLKIADKKANLKSQDITKEEINTIVFKLYNEINSKNEPRAFHIKDLKINGSDIIEILGIKEGPMIGKLMNSALDYVLDDPSRNDHQILRKFIKTFE